MAKTDGRGNAPWTRDETILALELFLDSGLAALSDSDTRVITLSETLRTLRGNEERAQSKSFRNAAGVSFKLSNLQSIATGRGFANASATDRAVWEQFGHRRQRVKEIVRLIKIYALEIPLSTEDQDDDVEFSEGSIFTRMHRHIERNRGLRKALIRDRRRRNLLRCDACFRVNPTADPELDDAIFDAHHLIPLSAQGPTKTKLSDAALLCANCHRLIHKLIAGSGRWASVEDVRNAINDDI
jgi:5-methylcytosine-specific restriction protein A